jgi:hypothetical protein
MNGKVDELEGMRNAECHLLFPIAARHPLLAKLTVRNRHVRAEMHVALSRVAGKCHLTIQITQCESVESRCPTYLWMWPPYALDQPVGAVLTIHFPPDVGYLEWTCNIPAGVSFFIEVGDFQYYGTVQPGTSSSCLGPLSVN